MANIPKKITRAYKPDPAPFEREVDNSWFYNNYKWRKFTKGYKQRHPFCKDCKENNIITPTKVVDHKHQYSDTAPGWDLTKLNDNDYEPKCTPCHNKRSGKQRHGKG